MVHDNVAIVILAAGASRRLGRPKQLEYYQNKTLIQHSIDTAKDTGISKMIVVFGARYQELYSSISHNDITILENKSWQEGMSTSLKQGLIHVQKEFSEVDKIIFMVCDQPFVSKQLILSLIEKNKETSLPIIASEYKEIKGTPALFDQETWPLLLKIEGDIGAGKIIKNNPDLVASVTFEKGEIDIDEESDLSMLLL